MHQSIISTLLLAPLAIQAARHRPQCSERTVTVTKTVTAGAVAPTVEQPVPSGFSSTVSLSPTLVTSISVTDEEQPTETPEVPESSSASDEAPVPENTQPSRSADGAPSATVDTNYADATETNVNIPARDQCGLDDRVIMPGLAWTVANSMYNGNRMQGTQCTDYKRVLKASDGTLLVDWVSRTNIDRVESTKNLCKGYSNIGIGKNLKRRLSDVKSIPTYFKWTRTITSDFKGANIYDFITSPTSGAGEVPGSNEFMLFLKIWGGQVPIGYAQGPKRTFDMYGTTWKLYEGKNEGNGQMVRSMIPDTPFEGEFQGDLKIWLQAMIDAGYAKSSEFLNIGNTGVEVFYGKSEQKAVVALDIKV